MNPNEMMSVEEALDCVLSHVESLEVETVSLLDAVGRVVAEDLVSDCDITPFDHAAGWFCGSCGRSGERI